MKNVSDMNPQQKTPNYHRSCLKSTLMLCHIIGFTFNVSKASQSHLMLTNKIMGSYFGQLNNIMQGDQSTISILPATKSSKDFL